MLCFFLFFNSSLTFAASKIKYFQNKSCQIFNDGKEKTERLPLHLDSEKENHIKRHFKHTNARLEMHGAQAFLHLSENESFKREVGEYGVSSLSWETVKAKLFEKWNSFEDIQLESSGHKQDTFKIKIIERGKVHSLVMKTGVVTRKGKDQCVPQTIYEMKKSGLQFRMPKNSALASWIKQVTPKGEFINIPRNLGYIESDQDVIEGKLSRQELKELLVKKDSENSDLDTTDLEPVPKRRRVLMGSGQ